MPQHLRVQEDGISDYEILGVAIEHAPFNFWERETVLGFNAFGDHKRTKIVNRLLIEGVLLDQESDRIIINPNFEEWGKYSVLRSTMYHEFRHSRCWCGHATHMTHLKEKHIPGKGCRGRIRYGDRENCGCIAFIPQTRPYEVWVKAQHPSEKPKKKTKKELGRLPSFSRR